MYYFRFDCFLKVFLKYRLYELRLWEQVKTGFLPKHLNFPRSAKQYDRRQTKFNKYRFEVFSFEVYFKQNNRSRNIIEKQMKRYLEN